MRVGGGVSIGGEIKPGIGWFVKNEAHARYVTSSFSVPYARFISSNDEWMDVRYTGGNPWSSESYVVTLADEKENPGYQFEIKNETVAGAIRLRSRRLVVRDIYVKKDVLVSKSFIFSWTDSRRTLLGMSYVDTCFSGNKESIRIGMAVKGGLE